MVGTYFAVAGGELNVKEKVFMAFAWMPKATVQAALGPIFLDNVKKQIAREDYPAFSIQHLQEMLGFPIAKVAYQA